MKGKAKGMKKTFPNRERSDFAFVISLPSVGTNHIKFKGLERFISSQLLTAAPPAF
jgi:hypothetical protein